MEQYQVTGMSCAACSARVEKAVSHVPGVISCSVSLLTNSMGVEGSASPGDIIKAVEEAGYGASLKEADSQQFSASQAAEALADHETPVLKKRLIASVGFLLVLMYFSMGHMMWGWPVPQWFEHNHVAMGLLQLLLAGIVMVINQKFFISGFKSLWHRLSQHGYSRCTWLHGVFYLERVCAFCHDRRSGQRRHGCCGKLYDGLLF